MRPPRIARVIATVCVGLALAVCALTACGGGSPGAAAGPVAEEPASAGPSSLDAPTPETSEPAVESEASSDMTPEPTVEPTEAETAPTEVATECVDGRWRADIDDLLGQLTRQFSASGLAISSSDASGSQELVIGREGVLGFNAEMTFVMTVDMGPDMAMTVTQQHSGAMSASWEWTSPGTDGGTMGFSDFRDSDYQLTNTVMIGDKESSLPFEPPSVAAADVPTEVTCAGDTMTTHPQGSPFTTTWTRIGSS